MRHPFPNPVSGLVLRQIELPEFLRRCVRVGCVALDVRVTGGTLSIGQQILLSGPVSDEVVKILAIETLPDSADARVFRLHCTRPKMLVPGPGGLADWPFAGIQAVA
jgi:hypothetical protein